MEVEASPGLPKAKQIKRLTQSGHQIILLFTAATGPQCPTFLCGCLVCDLCRREGRLCLPVTQKSPPRFSFIFNTATTAVAAFVINATARAANPQRFDPTHTSPPLNNMAASSAGAIMLPEEPGTLGGFVRIEQP